MAGSDLVPVDMELRVHETHHASLRLWLRLLSTTTLIEETVRLRLRDGFGISLPRFDLMAQLERHPEGITMGEISRRMMVSGGNITALVDQLENEALVQRRPAPQDRRSYTVALTATGRKAFSEMAQAHEAWVIELFEGLSVQQHEQLSQLLAVLKQGAYAQRESNGEIR